MPNCILELCRAHIYGIISHVHTAQSVDLATRNFVCTMVIINFCEFKNHGNAAYSPGDVSHNKALSSRTRPGLERYELL